MSDSFIFEVLVTPFNSAPTLASTIEENQTFNLFSGPYTLDITCQDLTDTTDTLVLSFQTPQPVFATITGLQLVFDPQSTLYLGNHQMEILCEDDNSVGSTGGIKSVVESFSFTVEAINTKPYFEENKIDIQRIRVKEVLVVYFPEVKDDDLPGDTLEFSFSIGGYSENTIPDFFMYNEVSRTMIVAPYLNNQTGWYEITLTVTDNNASGSSKGPLSTSMWFYVVISEFVEETFVVVVPEVEQEILESTTLAFYIESISYQGEVKLQFNEDLLRPANYTQRINSTVLELEIVSDYDLAEQDKPLISFWNTTLMTDSSLYLQLQFNSPSKVSNFQVFDKLKATIRRNNFFISTKSLKPIRQNSTDTHILLPQRSDVVIALGEAIQKVKKACLFVFSAAFFINLILAAFLNLVWSMLNTLQIIVYIPLIDIRFPQNAFVFSMVLMGLANFDFVPHDAINQAAMDFDEEGNQIKRIIFQEAGFKTYNFILNSGTVFWMILGYGFVALFIRFLKLFPCFYIKILYFYLSNKFFFAVIIRMILESYLELAIASFLNSQRLNMKESGESTSSIFAVAVFVSIIFNFKVVIIVSPFLTHCFLITRRYKLQEKRYQNTYGDLYLDNKSNTKQAMLYSAYFLFRRLVYSASQVYLYNFQVMQLAVLTLSSYSLILYTINYKPFKEKIFNYIDIFNEFVVLSLSYLAWTFSDHSSDAKLKFRFGWIYCGIISIFIAVNVCIMLYFLIFKSLIPQLRRKFCKKKQSSDKNKSKVQKKPGISITTDAQLLSATQSIIGSQVQQSKMGQRKILIRKPDDMITKEKKIENSNLKKNKQKVSKQQTPMEMIQVKDSPVLQVKNKKKFRRITENKNLPEKTSQKNAKDVLGFQKKKPKLQQSNLFQKQKDVKPISLLAFKNKQNDCKLIEDASQKEDLEWSQIKK